MKKSIVLILVMALAIGFASAQKYVTKTGMIKFYSDSPLEKIEGINNQVNSSLDIVSGDFIFKTLIKSFEFEKELMQEHFNDNYLESDQFPDATFKGKVTNLKDINFTKDGIYNAVVDGDLTIHGVTNKVSAKGTFEVKSGKIAGKSVFNVKVKDYKIVIPSAVAGNIAESIKVTVEITLDKL